GMSRGRMSALIQIRTGHAPLREHLNKLDEKVDRKCRNCRWGVTETVKHFMLDCPAWRGQRDKMRREGRVGLRELKKTLGTKNGLTAAIRFIERTGRLKEITGR
ncbi:hypothetical protein FA15DRAFT_546752, partial [Coprinopsis marcescibilis]